MLKRRSSWLGGTGALVLVLSLSGVVAAASALTADAGAAPVAEPLPAVDTTATFEDVDGNGIDDDCQAELAVADQVAVDAELATVDVNADGVISTTEAAQSERTGGANCNHGGYVSIVAHESGDCAVEPTAGDTVEPADDETVEPTEDETVELVVAEPDTTEPEATEPEVNACDAVVEPDAAPADCVVVAAPEREPVLEPSPNDHGKWTSIVAGSTAIGGKNCNHGGAVSDAVKADLEAIAAAREAAKAARAEARDAKKAERTAARDAKKANGHGHGHGH
jgi:hypothetical protein